MPFRYRFVTELFEAVDIIVIPDDRAAVLNFSMRESVRKILACIHNPEIEFFRPPNLEYKSAKNSMGLSDTTLDIEAKRLYIFQKSHPLRLERKKARLIQILESMSGEEADLLYNGILAKKNPYKNINKNFLKKYFPEIITLSIDRH